MTSQELKRWLEKQGCSFSPGKGGHLIVRLGGEKTVLPMHGKGHELPRGTVIGIKKALGLK
jgi:mRNA interferase HicA